MKIALDWEFYDDGVNLVPIALGMVNEFYETLYIEFDTVAELWDKIPDGHFVRQHVLPHLELTNLHTKEEAKKKIIRFCGENPVFYGWYCHYDMFLLQRLWGDFDAQAKTIWKYWPWYINDMKAITRAYGFPHLRPEEAKIPHHALHDAKAIMDFICYLEHLRK